MARGPKKDDSVFDFLYADHKRLAVLHSQFNMYGHLTRLLKQTTTSSGLSGGLNLAVTKLGSDKSEDQSLEKEYDAQWALPLAFLEELADRDMIERTISSASIGQFVLWSGDLTLRDLGMVKLALQLPSLKKEILAPPRDLTKEQQKEDRKNRERGLEMLSIIPDSIQAEIRSLNGTLWGVLRGDSLTSAFGDVALQYGTRIQGKWSMLGILDAKPDEQGMREQLEAANTIADTDWTQTGLGALMGMFGPFARQLLGRRPSQYGATPLLIFREIAPP